MMGSSTGELIAFLVMSANASVGGSIAIGPYLDLICSDAAVKWLCAQLATATRIFGSPQDSEQIGYVYGYREGEVSPRTHEAEWIRIAAPSLNPHGAYDEDNSNNKKLARSFIQTHLPKGME